MFGFITELKKKKKERKQLLAFYEEIAKNFELWHVMDQRNVLDFFQLQVWESIKTEPPVPFDEVIKKYGEVYESYNKEFKTFKDYELWYGADVKRKTPENAQKLHAQKQLVKEKFVGMLDVLTPAQKLFAQMLVEKEILKVKGKST